MARERLHKILAGWGVDSRRNCEQLILGGAVKVNGKIIDTLPAFADPKIDIITVSGRKIRPENKVYYLLNKPKGFLCTNNDPAGRKKAIDLVPPGGRIFCVGRLDADTTGAILLTNDTALADIVTHPRHELPKTYIVTIKGKVSTEAVEQMKKGVWLSDGKAVPGKVKIIKAQAAESILEIKISQSLNREIRRIMAKFGYKVTALKRLAIGKISTYKLGIGKFRPLTKGEIDYLKKE